MTEQTTLKVWLDHKLLREFPHDSRIREGSGPDEQGWVFILDESRQELARYGPGEWHAVNYLACGFTTPDETCENCRGPAPAG